MVLCKWLHLDPWPFPEVSDLGPFGPSCCWKIINLTYSMPMPYSAKFQAPPNAVDFLWSCEGVVLLCFPGQIVTWQYNPNVLVYNWPCSVMNDHEWQLRNCPLFQASGKPGQIALEPLHSQKAGVISLFIQLPCGDGDWAPPGVSGLAIGSALVSIGKPMEGCVAG